MQNHTTLCAFFLVFSLLFLSCTNKLATTSSHSSYQSLLTELQQADTTKPKETLGLLNKMVAISKSLPLHEVIIEGEEKTLSIEKGKFLCALLESSLTKKQLDYIYQRADFGSLLIENTSLKNAYLKNIVLVKSYLSEVDLTGADFSNATLAKTNIINSNLTKANFRKANCRATNFFGSEITEANFEMTYLREATFEKVIGNSYLKQINNTSITSITKQELSSL